MSHLDRNKLTLGIRFLLNVLGRRTKCRTIREKIDNESFPKAAGTCPLGSSSLTHSFLGILLKNAFGKYNRSIFWWLSGYKQPNITCMPSTSQSSDQDAKCCLSKTGCVQKNKFWILTFTFSPPLFFCFSCLIFFFCWAFTRVSLWWKKVLGKAFRWEEV